MCPTADEPRPEPGEGVGLGGDEHGLFTINGPRNEVTCSISKSLDS